MKQKMITRLKALSPFQKQEGLDGILVTIGLCIIALLLCGYENQFILIYPDVSIVYDFEGADNPVFHSEFFWPFALLSIGVNQFLSKIKDSNKPLNYTFHSRHSFE